MRSRHTLAFACFFVCTLASGVQTGKSACDAIFQEVLNYAFAEVANECHHKAYFLYFRLISRGRHDPSLSIDPKDVRILQIETLGRGGGGIRPLVSDKVSMEVGWSWHQVVEYRDWIYDPFFTGNPPVQRSRDYFHAMFVNNPNYPNDVLLDRLYINYIKPEDGPYVSLRQYLEWQSEKYE